MQTCNPAAALSIFLSLAHALCAMPWMVRQHCQPNSMAFARALFANG